MLNRTRTDERFQFGQPLPTHRLIPEGSACGAAVVQRVRRIWNGDYITMDRVVRASGADPEELETRGLFTSEVMRALQILVPKAKYHAATEVDDPRVLLNYARFRGPVLFIARYGDWPEWKGYRYFGTVADGKPNGYSRPLGESGKTQLTGFENGAHYGLLLTSVWNGDNNPAWLYDSNHNSIVRPEKPRWDVLDAEQFGQLYLSGRKVTTRKNLWAAYPEASL